MSFIAGQYTATYGGAAVGQAAEGFRLSHQFFKRLITGDSYAEAPQDAVYRGAAVELGFTAIEYNAAAMASLIWPYGTLLDMGRVGRTDVGSSLTKALVLTAVAGTPAANAPASLTLTAAILKEGFPVDLLMAPDLREVPLRLRAYPNTSGIFGTAT